MLPRLSLLALTGALLGPSLAQFPPTPEGVTVLKSKFDKGIEISFKEPGLCEEAEGVKSYAGYIKLPPGTLEGVGQEQDYEINTFFWFFEAKHDPENAPLSIWMNGGARQLVDARAVQRERAVLHQRRLQVDAAQRVVLEQQR
ncbi:hypothetical protein CH063_15074 [Colletotrichum higginsianum]|uniref:Uncharacterized protein n=1 Tax=Colletotrichum higginsianum (strain IMI 349063) TaxID=759273 RepID=H1W1A4_COLHI|nr:hypothetical protein CH063_15074 [Colletotrichum higginsianum]